MNVSIRRNRRTWLFSFIIIITFYVYVGTFNKRLRVKTQLT